MDKQILTMDKQIQKVNGIVAVLNELTGVIARARVDGAVMSTVLSKVDTVICDVRALHDHYCAECKDLRLSLANKMKENCKLRIEITSSQEKTEKLKTELEEKDNFEIQLSQAADAVDDTAAAAKKNKGDDTAATSNKAE